LSATATEARYDSFSFLDFEARDFRAAWLWQLGRRFSGTISEERRQSLVPFTDFRGFDRANIRTSTQRAFSADAWMIENWHAVGAVSQQDVSHDTPFLAESGYRSETARIGLRYAPPSGNSLTLAQNETKGDYLDRPLDPVVLTDNRFREQETEFAARWSPTGLTTVNGRLSWRQRRHEHFGQRDFSGAAGDVAYVWTPTGKLRLALTAKRDIRESLDLGSVTANSSYRVTDTLGFAPVWQVGTRTSVSVSFSHSTADFRGPVIPDPRPARQDRIRSAHLAIDWAPFRFVSLTASINRERRTSNNPNFDFRNTIASLSASLTF
jgi:exopolysaccharide biosynthesis operon protein EpsL